MHAGLQEIDIRENNDSSASEPQSSEDDFQSSDSSSISGQLNAQTLYIYLYVKNYIICVNQ